MIPKGPPVFKAFTKLSAHGNPANSLSLPVSHQGPQFQPIPKCHVPSIKHYYSDQDTWQLNSFGTTSVSNPSKLFHLLVLKHYPFGTVALVEAFKGIGLQTVF